jgi:acetyl-CoA carboxylase carboxyl transferase subunit beta
MAWFKRKEKELQLLPKTKWMDFGTNLLQENYWCWWVGTQFICKPEDGFHVRIGSSTYFEILFDNKFVS